MVDFAKFLQQLNKATRAFVSYQNGQLSLNVYCKDGSGPFPKSVTIFFSDWTDKDSIRPLVAVRVWWP